jgi:hypothetical protein
MEPIKWNCPHCNHHATIKSDNFYQTTGRLTIDNKHGQRALFSEFIVCPNPDCNEYTLTSYLFETQGGWRGGNYEYKEGKLLAHWNLIPSSEAKVFPDYIPKPILDDYNEACLIKSLSPKASATLSRRCLQGIIRDFWKISKSRLIDEIQALEEKIDTLTWQSIDAVRKIGNIGAHMEKDINIIVDVEPEEANLLIQLIELLLQEWYINRHEREKKLKLIVEVAKVKTEDKKKE